MKLLNSSPYDIPFLDRDLAAGAVDFPASVRSVTSTSSFVSCALRILLGLEAVFDFFPTSFSKGLCLNEVEYPECESFSNVVIFTSLVLET